MSATNQISATLGVVGAPSDVKLRLRKQIAVALATAAIGGAIILVSIFVFMMRVPVAAMFLGARVVFGVPVAEIDALKVLMVAIQAVAAAAHGLVVMVGGSGVAFIAFIRQQPL